MGIAGFGVPLLTGEQYEVVFSESFISAAEAESQLALQSQAQVSDAHEAAFKDLNLDQKPLAGDDTTDILQHMLFNNQEYLCRIPIVPPDAGEEQTQALDPEEKQRELMRASDHGIELLSGLQGNCLYYGAGWWVYSFCYNDDIKQFHPLPPGIGDAPVFPPTPDPNVPVFVLGKFKQSIKRGTSELGPSDGSKSANEKAQSKTTDLSAELQTQGESNFLVQKLGDGTVCDLTGKDRRVEVQFHCNPSTIDRISVIKETASCLYLMVVHTPRLCNEVAFQPPQLEKPHPIACQEIIAKEDEQAWKNAKAAEAEKELFSKKPQPEGQEGSTAPKEIPPPPRSVIGGIEVGARQLVGGSPERTIKASNIVRPQKPPTPDEYVATMAKSDGRFTTVMSEREIKRQGLKGKPEDLNELISKIEDWAGEGQPWRLDVMKTPRGMEFRGILMDEVEWEEQDRQEKQKRKEREEKNRNQEKEGAGSGSEQPDQSKEDEEQVGSKEEYKTQS